MASEFKAEPLQQRNFAYKRAQDESGDDERDNDEPDARSCKNDYHQWRQYLREQSDKESRRRPPRQFTNRDLDWPREQGSNEDIEEEDNPCNQPHPAHLRCQ